jgi:hypothetical protein
MNNSDYNDFKNWQNGDDDDVNNPNNNPTLLKNSIQSFNNLWKLKCKSLIVS